MPTWGFFNGYRIYFWTNENNEPVHVHVCKGTQRANATKLWITSKGNVLLANNSSRVPVKDLNGLMNYISSNAVAICIEWRNCFKTISFYC